MFARQVSRTVSGAVLLAGGLTMFASPPNAAAVVVASWCAALAAGVITRLATWRVERRTTFGALGLVAPLTGLAVIGPLTLHLPMALAIGSAADFGDWVGDCREAAGLAHICFAMCIAIHARGLAEGRTTLTPRAVYVFTLIAALVPYGPYVAFGVTWTGFPLVWVLPRHVFARIAERERAELTRPTLPTAIALSV